MKMKENLHADFLLYEKSQKYMATRLKKRKIAQISLKKGRESIFNEILIIF